MSSLTVVKVCAALAAIAASFALSGCVTLEPNPQVWTANGQVRKVGFYTDEVGSFEIMGQKISAGANFFEITKSCAGTTVVVKVEGNIGACQAEVKSKNFKKGQTGMFFTKWKINGVTDTKESDLVQK